MISNVVISNNSKHNNCSNHKPLTGLQYDNNQMAIPKLLLVIIYFTSITIITDISKAFDRVWDAGLLHKLKSYRMSGQLFGLISSFLSNRWL